MRTAASILLTFIMAACDPAQCPQMSGPFGPCITGYSACAEGSTCLSTADGDICLPPSPDGAPPQGYGTCIAKLGGTLSCMTGGSCLLTCDEDADCLGGTVCSEAAGACVWPPQSPGETTGTSTAGELSSSPSTGTTEAPADPSTSTTGTSTG